MRRNCVRKGGVAVSGVTVKLGNPDSTMTCSASDKAALIQRMRRGRSATASSGHPRRFGAAIWGANVEGGSGGGSQSHESSVGEIKAAARFAWGKVTRPSGVSETVSFASHASAWG